MFRPAPRASGYFRTGYAQDLALLQTRAERVSLVVFVAGRSPAFLSSRRRSCSISPARCSSPRSARSSLMLLTGYAGQISLGHAGLLAAGAFTAGILAREIHAPFWITLPAAAVIGVVLGLVFGLPSLRLRGLYLAVSTLALHFVVIYLGGEYETKRGFSTGILIEPPSLAGFKLSGGRVWYFVLLAAAAVTPADLHQPAAQPHRPRLARDPCARDGGRSARHQHRRLQAARLRHLVEHDVGRRRLFAYYRGFVSVEAFSLFLSIQYVAMIIIGGMGSLLGALARRRLRDAVSLRDRGAAACSCRTPQKLAGDIFAVNYAAFGVVMILFLVFEPLGLVGIWRRVQNYFLLWPFKHRPLAGARK